MISQCERVFWSIFICLGTCLGFSNFVLQSSPPFCFSCSSVSRDGQFTLFGKWVRLFCMLALYGTYRVHDNGKKSAAAKGAY
jgi:hypothetical protein